MAAEFGLICTRLTRIVEGLPHIGRAHVSRWGDGGAHGHWWFFARTARLPQILGSMAVEWDEIVPPGPEAVGARTTRPWRGSWRRTTVARWSEGYSAG